MDKIAEILIELRKETPRAKVILGAILIENHLEALLKKTITGTEAEKKELFSDTNSPLKSFSGKMKMAYHMGLISKQLKRDIDIIRKFRNECAHQIENISQNGAFKAKVVVLKSNLSKVGDAISKIPAYKAQWDKDDEAFSILVGYIIVALINKIESANQITECSLERAYQ